MRGITLFLNAALVPLLSGCLLGSFQTFKEIDMRCRVVSVNTGKPIEGARVSVQYAKANPNSPALAKNEFYTDKKGVCRIFVPRRTIYISGDDAFVGGYLRGVAVSAPGYKEGGLYEGFKKGMLSGIKEHKFELEGKGGE